MCVRMRFPPALIVRTAQREREDIIKSQGDEREKREMDRDEIDRFGKKLKKNKKIKDEKKIKKRQSTDEIAKPAAPRSTVPEGGGRTS